MINSQHRQFKMIKTFKKIMDGLSAQYADEYLSSTDKGRIINKLPPQHRRFVYPDISSIVFPHKLEDEKKHIAMLCNDSTNQNVLDYVLGNAINCSVDILYHGAHNIIASESFYVKARSSFSDNHVDVSIVKLINDSIDDIKDYLMSHRSLQYIVTDSHDQLMTTFLNNKSITRHLQIPIVLIN